MRRAAALVVTVVLAALSWEPPARRVAAVITVRVVDVQTHAAISNAIVTVDAREMRTDGSGIVRLTEPIATTIGVRAYGYQRLEVATSTLRGADPLVALSPIRVKALYLSMFGIASARLRGAALQLALATEINAVVVDVKGDRGLIAFPHADSLAERVGALKSITIKDLPGLVMGLHDRGLYTIARIVVFKDDRLASVRPDLAVHRWDGSLFRDRERLAWSDPYSHDVWNYNIAVAVAAARAGFDEIQFDYVRLPDARDVALMPPQTEAHREAAIDGFLSEARAALRPFNVFVAADIFGYVCWNEDDTGIGQRLEHVANVVDYISPMLYPSSFQFGIPGYRNPVEHPYEVVRRSLEEALRRTGVPAVRFRPWLQAFPDYAFRGGSFTAGQVRTQIDAAEDVGTDGWMLWNPHNRYLATDLEPES